jgi:DNA polymerase-4
VDPRTVMSARRVIHLRLSDFVVAIERRHAPGLTGVPVIVGGDGTGRGRVLTMSAEARAAGISTGMPLPLAASRCPGATFLAGSVQRHLDALAVADELLRDAFSLVEWDGLDAYAQLLVTPDDPALARRRVDAAQTWLREDLGLASAAGIATSKVAARAASSLVTPAGLLVLLPGYEARFLDPLDVTTLDGIDAESARLLHHAGVETLGRLASLEPREAGRWLGRGAVVLQRHARGVDDREVSGRRVPVRLVRDTVLPSPARASAALEAAIAALGCSLERRLDAGGWTARRVSVRLDLTDGRVLTDGGLLGTPPRPGTMEAAAAHLASRLCATRPLVAGAAVRASDLRLARDEREARRPGEDVRVPGGTAREEIPDRTASRAGR